MNRVSLAVLFALPFVATGCSKSVDREGQAFAVTEPPATVPTPVPTGAPSPIPSSAPSPVPSPRPTPSPSPTPVSGCDPAKLGSLPLYAVYVREDLDLEKVSIGKRVAAADACIQFSELGTRMAADKSRADLSVSHVLGLNRSKIPNGKATYGSKLENTKSTALGGIGKAPFEMKINLKKIFDFSKACDAAKPNAETKKTCVSHGNGKKVCTVTVRGTHPRLNLAELKPEHVAGIQFFRIDVPEDSTLVVSAPKIASAKFSSTQVLFADAMVEAAGEAKHTVYWNFGDADALGFDSTRFRGTVVAPDAEISVCGQAGEMGFWTRKLKASASNW